MLTGRGQLDDLDARSALARAIELAAAGVSEAAADRFGRIDVDDEEALFEARCTRNDRTRVVEHHRVPVEDELVLAPYEVAEGEVRARVPRARHEHLLALLRLSDVERRRGEVHDELRTGEREIGRGWPGLPDVLADRDPDCRLSEPQDDEVASLGEVAVLVEDAVVWEVVLAVDGLDATVCTDGARVREIAVEPRRPDECDEAFSRRCDLLHGLLRCTHEPRPKEEVLRRIAARGELGEHDEVGVGGSRVVEGREDAVAIAVEVADDRIQLGEGDSQGFRLTVTNRV